MRLPGPSPRVWGKHYRDCSVRDFYRSIPTGVGKTGPLRLLRWSSAVHPHGGGENRYGKPWIARVTGPSPRVWGKPSNT